MLKHSTILKNKNIDSIAIGGFDGIHIAHQELINRLTKNGAIVIIDKGYANLTPKLHRCDFVNKECLFLKLEKIKNLNGKEFVDFLKEKFPNLEKIIVGYDFSFGKNRESNANDLSKLFDKKVEIVKEIKIEGVSVHSQTIREMLKNGDIRKANLLLGREYSITGDVIKGLGLGKKELFATINLKIQDYLLPKEGVYATFSKIKKQLFPSVTFIGKRATIYNSFSIETHVLDETIQITPNNVKINFVEFLRENIKFDSLESLKSQISKDIKNAKITLSHF